MSALVPTRVMEMHRREQAALGGRIAVGAAELVRTQLNVDDPDRGFSALLAALLELIRGGRSVSEELAMEFYRYLREVEGASGQAPDVPPVPFPTDSVVGSMIYLGPRMAKAMRRRGDDTQLAARVGGAVGRSAMRHTLNAGREATRQAVMRDPAAWGWARVTDADPCDFCRMLAARGPVYKSAAAAGELRRYHDGCACSVVAVFRGGRSSVSPPRGRSRRGSDGLTDRRREVIERVRREVAQSRT